MCPPLLLTRRIMDNNELILHKNKTENCFRMLAACFYEPEKDLFAEADLFDKLREHLEEICPEAAGFASEMGKSIQQYSDEDLRIEHAKLFMGPFELIAPPYGSVYLDEGGRVMGDSTMEIIDVYQKEDLARSDDFKDLPDHIVVEMEFMSYLIFKEREALERSDAEAAAEYRQKQSSFLKNYIHSWVPAFCKKIKEGTNNGFYSALADCVSTFITNSRLATQLT